MNGNGYVSPRSQKVDFHSGLALKILGALGIIVLTALTNSGVGLLRVGVDNQRQLAVALEELNGGIQVLSARVVANQREIEDVKEDINWIRDRLMDAGRPTDE